MSDRTIKVTEHDVVTGKRRVRKVWQKQALQMIQNELDKWGGTYHPDLVDDGELYADDKHVPHMRGKGFYLPVIGRRLFFSGDVSKLAKMLHKI